MSSVDDLHYPGCPARGGWGDCNCYEIDMARRHEEIDDRWWAAREEQERG